MKQQRVVLASSSTYRREALRRLEIRFESASPEVDETPLADESPEALVERLSLSKAKALRDEFPDAVIIGSDQIALHQGQILGKPGTVERAVAQLKAFSGKEVQFLTGLAVYSAETGESRYHLDTTFVQFRELEEEQIRAYIEREMPLNCAGSFKSEGLGIVLFERIRNDDPSALIGLPLIATAELLQSFGIKLL